MIQKYNFSYIKSCAHNNLAINCALVTNRSTVLYRTIHCYRDIFHKYRITCNNSSCWFYAAKYESLIPLISNFKSRWFPSQFVSGFNFHPLFGVDTTDFIKLCIYSMWNSVTTSMCLKRSITMLYITGIDHIIMCISFPKPFSK